MNIITNLRGRLKNTVLPLRNGLLPVFEAVSNAIHAIEDANLPMDEGQISLEIVRAAPLPFAGQHDGRKQAPIMSFRITDNGIGFTDENFTSFLTLDSQYKAERAGRGVGRLLWLKAFGHANVTSVFRDSVGDFKRRTFTFSPSTGIPDSTLEGTNDDTTETLVELLDFKENYKTHSPKTTKVIANNLLAHCLWYFVRPGGAPHITISDTFEQVTLDDIYEQQMLSSARPESINIQGVDFELIHVKLSDSLNWEHSIAFCAAQRVVKEESIKGKIPGLFGVLEDENGNFVYQCYVSSPLLDDRVRSERTSFDIAEEPTELFAAHELSFRVIRQSVIEKAADFLADCLEEKKEIARKRVNDFVMLKAPRYRPILPRIPEDQLAVDPSISDRDLDLFLHGHLAELEGELLDDGHEMMAPWDQESFSDYKARLEEYLAKAEDIKRSDLANYVSHRKVILDLLESAIKRNDDGTYAREELIHGLIMPLRKDSTEIPLDGCNLWVIDERLAFHDYLASDKPLRTMPITGAPEREKPDIVSLKIFDNPVLMSEGTQLPPAALVIVELKRPMRDDARQGEEKDPIEQALGYLDRIRQGKVYTAAGRLIPASEHVPGFCYVICDLTTSVVKRCRMHDAIRTSDGLGYFFYNKAYGAYVNVMSFDQVLNSAKERNRAFFDKLGFPSK